MFFASNLYSQPPQTFKYQAVARDAIGNIIVNQTVSFKISILQGSASGTVVYSESHTLPTNDYGLVNLIIGNGTNISGDFSNIDWGSSGNDIYSANLGKVGVGTSSPDGKFSVKAPNGIIGYNSSVKSMVITDGLLNNGNEFEVLEYNGNPKFRILDNGYVVVGSDTKGLQMRTDGQSVDLESIGTDLAINYQNGNNTLLNVNSGNVGIGTDNLQYYKLHVRSGSTPFLAENTSSGNYGTIGGSVSCISGMTSTGTGVVGNSEFHIGVLATTISGTGLQANSQTGLAGDFNGSVNITGYLSKGGGSFVIDHPGDPEYMLLRHNFVESPENLLIYRGEVKLNENGEGLVVMPGYFGLLTDESGATIHLTPIGKEPFIASYEWNPDHMGFNIYGKPEKSVSWQVLAERDDPVIKTLRKPIEETKGPDNKLCEKGKLLYPEAYGYPETKSKYYESNKKVAESLIKKQ